MYTKADTSTCSIEGMTLIARMHNDKWVQLHQHNCASSNYVLRHVQLPPNITHQKHAHIQSNTAQEPRGRHLCGNLTSTAMPAACSTASDAGCCYRLLLAVSAVLLLQSAHQLASCSPKRGNQTNSLPDHCALLKNIYAWQKHAEAPMQQPLKGLRRRSTGASQQPCPEPAH